VAATTDVTLLEVAELDGAAAITLVAGDGDGDWLCCEFARGCADCGLDEDEPILAVN